MIAPILLLLSLAAADAEAVPVKDVPETVANPLDKMICKKFLETGSLVKSKRVCKTKRDWARDQDEIRSNAAAQSSSCQFSATGACGN